MNILAREIKGLCEASETSWERAADLDRSILATHQFISDWDATSVQWADALVAITNNDSNTARLLLERAAATEDRYIPDGPARKALSLLK